MNRLTERHAAALVFELEAHAAALGRLIYVLNVGAEDARRRKDIRLLEHINRDIAYNIEQLAALHARRDAIRRQLGG